MDIGFFCLGINAGVVRQVAAAIDGSSTASRVRSKIVTIGIAPWGLLKKRDNLLGQASFFFFCEFCHFQSRRYALDVNFY